MKMPNFYSDEDVEVSGGEDMNTYVSTREVFLIAVAVIACVIVFMLL